MGEAGTSRFLSRRLTVSGWTPSSRAISAGGRAPAAQPGRALDLPVRQRRVALAHAVPPRQRTTRVTGTSAPLPLPATAVAPLPPLPSRSTSPVAGAHALAPDQIAETDRQLALLAEATDINRLRDEHTRLQATLDAAAADRARQLRRHPHTYVTDLLGPPPGHPRQAGVWDEALEAITRYRTRWLVDDPHHAIGQPENHPIQQAHRRTTLWALRYAAAKLHHLQRDRGTGQDIGHDRGLELA